MRLTVGGVTMSNMFNTDEEMLGQWDRLVALFNVESANGGVVLTFKHILNDGAVLSNFLVDDKLLVIGGNEDYRYLKKLRGNTICSNLAILSPFLMNDKLGSDSHTCETRGQLTFSFLDTVENRTATRSVAVGRHLI